MNHVNKKQKQGEEPSADDKALDKLEEMWDKQVLKGDDEFYETRISSRSLRTKPDLSENHEPVKQRRGRKM